MNRKDSLTPSEEALMHKLSQWWIDFALGGNCAIDRAKLEEGHRFIYSLAKYAAPKFQIVPSPRAMVEAACEASKDFARDLKAGRIGSDRLGIGYDAAWVAFYDFFQQIGIDYGEIPFNQFMSFIKSGVWDSILFDELAIYCQRPSSVKLNADKRLHSATGMAIEWADGYGRYFLNGVAVEGELVNTPAEKLDVRRWIQKEQNAEVRREAARRIGIERVCQKLNAKCVDKRDGYELLMLDMGDGRSRPYLKMMNPSLPGVYHVEGVHPSCDSIEKALNFRNGTEERPDVLT